MVIAIIGIIAAIAMVSLGESRSKGRDAHRAQQAQEVLKALELYYSNNGAYPADGVSGVGAAPAPLAVIATDIVASGHLRTVPEDPYFDANEGYLYCSADNGHSVALLVHLENTKGTDYCVIGRGEEGYSNNLCSGIETLDLCSSVF